MLKHMLTQGTPRPLRKGEEKMRHDKMATVVGIPSLEELGSMAGSSPTVLMGGGGGGGGNSESPRPESSNSNSHRPVSVHGNLIHNHNIYANLSASASPTNNNIAKTNKKFNQSFNGQLNNYGLLDSSKVSSSNASNGNGTRVTLMDSSSSRDQSRHELDSTQISPITRSFEHPRRQNMMNGNARPVQNTTLNHSHLNALKSRLNASQISRFMLRSSEAGVREMITSLGLLCLVSLLLALMSLIFLLKISRSNDENLMLYNKYDIMNENEYAVVYDVTLAMCALALSLNICCLLVCTIQFIFAVKLIKYAHGKARTNEYLKEAAFTRSCAIGGFFVSIPVFLTGIILYTFLHFESTPAIITSVIVGLCIVFCGAAVVHNVYIWQKEKSNAEHGTQIPMTPLRKKQNSKVMVDKSGKSFTSLPQATLDLSSGPSTSMTSAKGLELSTLV